MKARQLLPGPVPRRLRDRSKYNPHQSVREQMRRVGQVLRGQIPFSQQARGTFVSDETKAVYIDYATSKAAGQSLLRFRPEPPKPLLGDLEGVPGVTYLPEEGPSPAQEG